MGHFLGQNQPNLTVLYACSLGFPEIVPDERHSKLAKNDYFGFYWKTHIMLKMVKMDQALELVVHCYVVLVT